MEIGRLKFIAVSQAHVSEADVYRAMSGRIAPHELAGAMREAVACGWFRKTRVRLRNGELVWVSLIHGQLDLFDSKGGDVVGCKEKGQETDQERQVT